MKKIASIILIAFVTSLFTFAIAKKYIYSDQVFSMSRNTSTNPDAHFTNYTPSSSAEGGGYVSLEDAAEKASKAVVHIKTEKKMASMQNRNPFGDDLFEQFFGGRGQFMQPQPQQGSGSGVIISEDGYIVTNNHVVDGADEVTVVMNDKKTLIAKVIGKDAATDLAVLKVEEQKLPYLTFGNSDDVRLGQWVLAVGYPLSLETTVTAGIVSAKYRNIGINQTKIGNNSTAVESFIQTDAAVNPGNSGGALVNTRGELVGINTAIASQTGSYSGYSFAVPVNLVQKVMRDLIDYGIVQRGYLGVQISDISQEIKEKNKLPNLKGVFVAKVFEDGSADKAGLNDGDVILKIGNKDVNSVASLQEEIGKRRPGDKVSITIRQKDGDEIIKELVLRNQEGETTLVSKEEIKKNIALGASFTELTDKEKKELNISYGVRIKSLAAGKLKSLGLTEGTIITKINNEPIETVEQLTTKLNGMNRGILLEIMSESGSKDYVGFGL